MNKRICNRKDKQNLKKYIGILGGIEEKEKTNDFKGGEVYSILGSVNLDLRQV